MERLAPTTFVSDTQLTAAIPAADTNIAAAGSAWVTVQKQPFQKRSGVQQSALFTDRQQPRASARYSLALRPTVLRGENAGDAAVTVTRTGGLWSSKRHFPLPATALQRHLGTTPRLVRPLASPMATPPTRPLAFRSLTTPLLKRTTRSI